ncbi:MAG: Rrf2 family transcriptional regulator [Deltaproteobacteria bacterium]|nr:Rrf2 family transcriptional regulator [Deltaproteobacteria bacterium]
MKLTQSSMYALQSLAWLSSKKHPALSKEIAEDLSISPTYLTKILQTLRLAGILKATRGKNGGFQLNRSPTSIKLRTVIALFEDLVPWNFCPFTQTICDGNPKKPCRLHHRWKKVLTAFDAFVDHSTVADLNHAA